MQLKKKKKLLQLRRYRIRKTVSGSSERPRLAVKFSNTHIYVQFIDDTAGKTLAFMSTRLKSNPEALKLKANVAGATRIGELAAEAAKKAGISKVVFDRGGMRYHGKVAALAAGARKGGLVF